jgi:flagellar biosynthesis chaperone FliJ
MNFRIHVEDHLANEDQFVKIQALIEAKKQSLIDKQKKLKSVTKSNQFLNTVKEDYAKYYNVIIAQKQDQIKAISMLNEYIDDLASSGELNKHNIEDAKVEQMKLLREVNHIKKGLDSLSENTNHVTNELRKKI